MKVYDRNLTGAGAAETTRSSETSEVGRSSGDSMRSLGGSGDRVELSGTLGRLTRALAADGASRSARVEALAARYQSGNYTPNLAGAGRGLVADALNTTF